MSAQYPLIVARLVVLLPTLGGFGPFTVNDGPFVATDPPPNYVLVGATSGEEAGSYAIEQAPDGFRWQERGLIHNEVLAGTGDSDPAAARTVVQAALDGIDAAVRVDRRLGVLSAEGTSSFMVTLAPVLDIQGSAFYARFALNYFTVT